LNRLSVRITSNEEVAMEGTVRAPIRVRFAEQETGWALPLEHGRALIANIPLTGRYNLRDVVTLEDAGAGGLPRVGRVIERHYAAKCVLYYSRRGEFERLCDLLEQLGCETEGGQRPLAGQPGSLLVAYHGNVNPVELASGMGISQSTGEAKGDWQ
jgi:hypothetical protein